MPRNPYLPPMRVARFSSKPDAWGFDPAANFVERHGPVIRHRRAHFFLIADGALCRFSAKLAIMGRRVAGVGACGELKP